MSLSPSLRSCLLRNSAPHGRATISSARVVRDAAPFSPASSSLTPPPPPPARGPAGPAAASAAAGGPSGAEAGAGTGAGAGAGRTTHFGFRDVPESEKETLVGGVFSSVASKYDLMNDSMSLGIHRLWKDSFVQAVLPRLPPSLHQNQNQYQNQNQNAAPVEPFRCLDVAGGTGDIALRILDRARETYGSRDVQVEIVDLNMEMLDEGRKRVAKTLYYNTPQISFTHGNAQSLPSHIPSNSIDLYTIAFGIRNCLSIPAVLSEAHRVLKPGGRIGVLEFGKVSNPLLKEVYRQYSFQFIPIMGKILAGDSESYQYLVESIEKFPTQEEFARLMQDAGFQTGKMREGKGGAWTDFTFGVASMWTGVKL